MAPEDPVEFPPLHKACAQGNTTAVERLLNEDGAKLSIHALAGDRMCTPLHIAAEYEKEDVVAFLLQKGAASDLQKGDHEGDTPLHIACNVGNLSILKLMLDALEQGENFSLINIVNTKKQTLLHYAAGRDSKDKELVGFLLEKDADMKNARDYRGATPFHFAARGGNVSVMKKLMNHVDDENNFGLTALHYAAWNGHVEIVKWLLNNEAPVSIADKLYGDTPLHLAARNRDVPSLVIESLIDKGADMSATNSRDELPVDVAIQSRHSSKVIATFCKAMIKAPTFNPLRDHKNGTLLHYAAAYATRDDVVSVLWKMRNNTARKKDGKEENYRKNVNRKNKKGQNAFHCAASQGNTIVMETLHRENVDPSVRDEDNMTPLCLALLANELEFAGTLLKCLGQTPTGSLLSDALNEIMDKDLDEREQILSSFKVHIKGSPSNVEIMREIPSIYKLLHASNGKGDIAKFVEANKQEILSEFVNQKGNITRRTALHWATILKQKCIVLILCSTKELSDDLAANLEDYQGKTALEYATEPEIMRELLKRPEVKSRVDALSKDQKVYQNFSNAVLVGATMIVGITFEGLKESLDSKSPVIWISNTFALLCSFSAVFVGIIAMLPVSDYSKLSKEVKNSRLASIGASLLLAFAFNALLVTFIAAAYDAYPSSSKYQHYVLGVSFFVQPLWFFFVGKFFWHLVKSGARRPFVDGSPLADDASLQRKCKFGRADLVEDKDRPNDTSIYKKGNRHAYMPWEDGLDVE